MQTDKIPDATLPPELRAMQTGLNAVEQALHPAIPGSPALADEVAEAHREAMRADPLARLRLYMESMERLFHESREKLDLLSWRLGNAKDALAELERERP